MLSAVTYLQYHTYIQIPRRRSYLLRSIARVICFWMWSARHILLVGCTGYNETLAFALFSAGRRSALCSQLVPSRSCRWRMSPWQRGGIQSRSRPPSPTLNLSPPNLYVSGNTALLLRPYFQLVISATWYCVIEAINNHYINYNLGLAAVNRTSRCQCKCSG